MSKQPDRFAAAVRAVFGRSASAQKIEALRVELIRAGIMARGAGPRKSPRTASDMAGEQIDKMADPSASDAERHTRKQRLLRGPKEFRDIRGDLPTRK